MPPDARDEGLSAAPFVRWFAWALAVLLVAGGCAEEELNGPPILSNGLPAQLDIRVAGERAIRVTLRPLAYPSEIPYTPVLAVREEPTPALSLRSLEGSVEETIGGLRVEVAPDPLRVIVTNDTGEWVQSIVFEKNGTVGFPLDDSPVLGLGEGGPWPTPGVDWREDPVEYDRRGRFHNMYPRWQTTAYGSRNPVALLVGTRGWGLYFVTPWGRIDLEDDEQGLFIPRDRASLSSTPQDADEQNQDLGQGIPPLDSMFPGVYDVFVFDAEEPSIFMHDVAAISGPAVLPPRWALGYMQSHRTLEDDSQMTEIVDTFREKEIPIDAVIYLGTGFTPSGWNEEQPSYEYNPEVFRRDAREVFADLHDRNVRVILHTIPRGREDLPTLRGSIPPGPDERVDASHMYSEWREHEPLIHDGVNGWWPDDGDWFDLFERMNRHQMYYQGSLLTEPDLRPWSLHRNGHLGIARWGGWMWSGDTDSTWKALEAQIAVGLNHSLSLSPFWGSDIGGFFPTEELTGELYVRWFQFGAFTPSFRSHGRTWWTRLPWGWGLSDRGPLESNTPPLQSAMNNPDVEPIAKQYAELRYRLLSYAYTLAWEARDTGMPMMRAMWLHHPKDELARRMGDQYLWGRDLLIAPVYEPGATSRDVYLPGGEWYDWWTNGREGGDRTVTREVDLSTMPIYVRAGAIIPFDPVRQFTDQPVDDALTLRIYQGADGEYTLYEDDGISLDYLDDGGERTRITWDDGDRAVVIEPGGGVVSTDERFFRIEVLPEGIVEEVVYFGQRVDVRF